MRRANSRRPKVVLIWLTGLLLVTFAVSLQLGSTSLSPGRVAAALLGRGEWIEHLVVVELRLPRLLLGVLIGAGLAVAGVLLQGLSRNDLASPSTIGVDAGAGLGMMLLLVMNQATAIRLPWLLPIAAVAGAMATTALVFAVA